MLDPFEALIEEGLGASLDTGGARYFGFPHGSVSDAAVRGASLLARLNPELATRHHALFASEVEARATSLLGAHFYGELPHGGIVTTGASEANLCALELALVRREPRCARLGVRGLRGSPRVYVSNDAHPSVLKACRMAGLGDEALTTIPSDACGRMKPRELARIIGEQRSRGDVPIAVVATFGTTTLGALDPVREIAEVARASELFVHVDAAYGGFLAFTGARVREVGELALADSISFDPPKVFDVPIGAGLLFARDKSLFRAAFSVPARYLPRTGDEPYATTPSWSRSARLLPLVFALAARGLDGVAEALSRKLELGVQLAEALGARGYRTMKGSALPVVGFTDERLAKEDRAEVLTLRSQRARERIGAYVPLVRLPSGDAILRAAIVSDHTTHADVLELARALEP